MQKTKKHILHVQNHFYKVIVQKQKINKLVERFVLFNKELDNTCKLNNPNTIVCWLIFDSLRQLLGNSTVDIPIIKKKTEASLSWRVPEQLTV